MKHTCRTTALTAEQEQDLARKMRDVQQEATEALLTIPSARRILQVRPVRIERTKGGAFARLEKAIKVAQQLCAPTHTEAIQTALRAWNQNEQMRWQLAMSGTRIAKGEARKIACSFYSAEDLEQEGYIGLLNAATRFDPDRGIRFSTYACWWVRATMFRAIEKNGRMIRLPSSSAEALRRIHQLKAQWDQQGVDVTPEMFAEELQLPLDHIKVLLAYEVPVSVEELRLDEDDPFDRIAQDEQVSPEQRLITDQFAHWAKQAITAQADSREEYILTRHLGLDGKPHQTMAEIGRDTGLSRERVRQLEQGVLRRLRTLL